MQVNDQQDPRTQVMTMASMIKQLDNVGIEAGIGETIVYGNLRDFAFMVQGFRKFCLKFTGMDVDPYDLESAVIMAIFNAAGITFVDNQESTIE